MFGSISLYIRLAVLLAFVGLAVTAYFFYQRAEIAVLEKEKAYGELDKAIGVNKKNTKTIADLERKAAEDRKATEKEIAQTQLRDQAIDEISKDMDNVEGANAPAGPYWDTFGERLRQSRRNH
jgi:uncharacterized protein HemX